MNKLAPRVTSLEQDARHVRRLSHEDALKVLDADPGPLPDFSDPEIDAEWRRLVALWSEAP